jgi:hypothetical protein
LEWLAHSSDVLDSFLTGCPLVLSLACVIHTDSTEPMERSQ